VETGIGRPDQAGAEERVPLPSLLFSFPSFSLPGSERRVMSLVMENTGLPFFFFLSLFPAFKCDTGTWRSRDRAPVPLPPPFFFLPSVLSSRTAWNPRRFSINELDDLSLPSPPLFFFFSSLSLLAVFDRVICTKEWMRSAKPFPSLPPPLTVDLKSEKNRRFSNYLHPSPPSSPLSRNGMPGNWNEAVPFSPPD